MLKERFCLELDYNISFKLQDLANVYELNITDICHFSETDYVSTEQHILEMENIVTTTYQRTRGKHHNNNMIAKYFT